MICQENKTGVGIVPQQQSQRLSTSIIALLEDETHRYARPNLPLFVPTCAYVRSDKFPGYALLGRIHDWSMGNGARESVTSDDLVYVTMQAQQ
jgi:hypothetical protein